ncbi:MAG TPA: hypothetical protein VIF15_19765 [Polyangiaceae bacterium]
MTRTRSLARKGLPSLLAVCAMATYGATASAANGLSLETVSDYTLWYPDGSANTDLDTEGAGFWNAMTAPGTLWTPTHWYKDNSVYDTDLYDPDRTGFSGDNDSGNFDPANTGISMVMAHGECGDVTTVNCASDADCGLGSYCPGEPLLAGESKTCIAESYRRIFTSSTHSQHNNQVWYGSQLFQSPLRNLAFGEDASSGSFGGAGLNGGTNVAIIVNSCGARSRYVGDFLPMFAGVHTVMMTMPTAAYRDKSGTVAFSDTRQWSARGSTFANFILTNTNAPATDAWFNPTMSSNGFMSTDGEHAFGAQIALASDSTWAATTSHLFNESWLGTTFESNDAKGNGYFGAWFACNYDCATYGD